MRFRSILVALVVLVAVLGNEGRAHALVRHTVDDQELANVRAASPDAARAYEAAEARLRAGDLAGAAPLLAQARALRPLSFLLARRECQVLTELGKRDEAIKACLAALPGGTAMDSRAYVGALMSGNALVKPKDLVDAAHEAANARRLVGQPFSDAAYCEIALHIGDDALFTACLAGLQKDAPGYFETARWSAARPTPSVAWYWLGWSLLGALGALAAGQSFQRWFRSPAPGARKTGTAALGLLTVALGVARPAHADEPPPSAAAPSAAAAAPAPTTVEVPLRHYQLSQIPINFDDPELKIPTIAERNADPLEFGYFLQDLAAEALKAERNSDYRKAVKFWRASARAVPDEAVGFSHACRDYQILQERENAVLYCARALILNGATTADFLRFSELMVSTPNPLTNDEIRDMDTAITHLRAQANGAGPAAVMECQLGVKLGDEARLARCTSVLTKTTPNDPHTLTFQWSLAMKRHDYSQAKQLLAAMAKTTMPPASIAQLSAATDKEGAWWRRPFVDPRYGFALLCLFGAGAFFALRKRAQFRAAPEGAAPAA